MANYLNPWLENFERQVMYRRAVLLSGNTGDLSFDQFDSLRPCMHIITSSLRNKGFEMVVRYNRVAGITGVTQTQWNDLKASLLSTTPQGTIHNVNIGRSTSASSGAAYDMGFTPTHNESESTSSNSSYFQESTTEFFSTVERVLQTRERKVAFIIDWSHYMFGQVNNLDNAERELLTRLSSAIRDSARTPYTVQAMQEARSIICFVTNGQLTLPPSLFLNNPLFGEVTIPLPSTRERQAAIQALQAILNVQEDISPNSKGLAQFVTQTDGLKLYDIENLARLSTQHPDRLNITNLISLYRFGKSESPWEQLNSTRIENVEKMLQQRVKGQDQAIQAVNRILIRAYTGLSGLQHSAKARTPKGALFFVGPTGVGKTELAKSLAQFLFGDEDACIRFDMSEFNHEHADQRLVGAPPGYVGYEQGGQLTNAVKTRPFSLLLFDEIEKAHPRILDKFLQILEDGRLTDGKGETVSFTDTFIVFTSNLGAAQISPSNDAQHIASQFKEYVANHFRNELNRPELLSRIGEANIIPFNFITDSNTLKMIAMTKLIMALPARLKEKYQLEVRFTNPDASLNYLVRDINFQNGGRAVLGELTRKLYDPLADFLFNQKTENYSMRTLFIDLKQLNNREYFDFSVK